MKPVIMGSWLSTHEATWRARCWQGAQAMLRVIVFASLMLPGAMKPLQARPTTVAATENKPVDIFFTWITAPKDFDSTDNYTVLFVYRDPEFDPTDSDDKVRYQVVLAQPEEGKPHTISQVSQKLLWPLIYPPGQDASPYEKQAVLNRFRSALRYQAVQIRADDKTHSLRAASDFAPESERRSEPKPTPSIDDESELRTEQRPQRVQDIKNKPATDSTPGLLIRSVSGTRDLRLHYVENLEPLENVQSETYKLPVFDQSSRRRENSVTSITALRLQLDGSEVGSVRFGDRVYQYGPPQFFSANADEQKLEAALARIILACAGHDKNLDENVWSADQIANRISSFLLYINAPLHPQPSIHPQQLSTGTWVIISLSMLLLLVITLVVVRRFQSPTSPFLLQATDIRDPGFLIAEIACAPDDDEHTAATEIRQRVSGGFKHELNEYLCRASVSDRSLKLVVDGLNIFLVERARSGSEPREVRRSFSNVMGATFDGVNSDLAAVSVSDVQSFPKLVEMLTCRLKNESGEIADRIKLYETFGTSKSGLDKYSVPKEVSERLKQDLITDINLLAQQPVIRLAEKCEIEREWIANELSTTIEKIKEAPEPLQRLMSRWLVQCIFQSQLKQSIRTDQLAEALRERPHPQEAPSGLVAEKDILDRTGFVFKVLSSSHELLVDFRTHQSSTSVSVATCLTLDSVPEKLSRQLLVELNRIIGSRGRLTGPASPDLVQSKYGTDVAECNRSVLAAAFPSQIRPYGALTWLQTEVERSAALGAGSESVRALGSPQPAPYVPVRRTITADSEPIHLGDRGPPPKRFGEGAAPAPCSQSLPIGDVQDHPVANDSISDLALRTALINCEELRFKLDAALVQHSADQNCISKTRELRDAADFRAQASAAAFTRLENSHRALMEQLAKALGERNVSASFGEKVSSTDLISTTIDLRRFAATAVSYLKELSAETSLAVDGIAFGEPFRQFHRRFFEILTSQHEKYRTDVWIRTLEYERPRIGNMGLVFQALSGIHGALHALSTDSTRFDWLMLERTKLDLSDLVSQLSTLIESNKKAWRDKLQALATHPDRVEMTNATEDVLLRAFLRDFMDTGTGLFTSLKRLEQIAEIYCGKSADVPIRTFFDSTLGFREQMPLFERRMHDVGLEFAPIRFLSPVKELKELWGFGENTQVKALLFSSAGLHDVVVSKARRASVGLVDCIGDISLWGYRCERYSIHRETAGWLMRGWESL